MTIGSNPKHFSGPKYNFSLLLLQYFPYFCERKVESQRPVLPAFRFSFTIISIALVINNPADGSNGGLQDGTVCFHVGVHAVVHSVHHQVEGGTLNSPSLIPLSSVVLVSDDGVVPQILGRKFFTRLPEIACSSSPINRVVVGSRPPHLQHAVEEFGTGDGLGDPHLFSQ